MLWGNAVTTWGPEHMSSQLTRFAWYFAFQVYFIFLDDLQVSWCIVRFRTCFLLLCSIMFVIFFNLITHNVNISVSIYYKPTYLDINVLRIIFCLIQTELQLLQTALIETKCQILQALAGAMDRPASKQLEVMHTLAKAFMHAHPSKLIENNKWLWMLFISTVYSLRLLPAQKRAWKTLNRGLRNSKAEEQHCRRIKYQPTKY